MEGQCAEKKAENLKRLSKTNLISDFVKKNKGCWDHQAWLNLCEQLKSYMPIDFDQVGLLLEAKKHEYHTLKKEAQRA